MHSIFFKWSVSHIEPQTLFPACWKVVLCIVGGTVPQVATRLCQQCPIHLQCCVYASEHFAAWSSHSWLTLLCRPNVTSESLVFRLLCTIEPSSHSVSVPLFFFLKKWISCLTFIVRWNVDAWAHSAQRSYANKWTSICGSLWGMTNTSPVSRHVPDAVRYITRQLCYPHFTTPASSHDEGMLGIHQGSMMQRANGGIECSVFVSM